MTDDPEGSDGYKIGYGKPPKHTRFKPGESGNPKGKKPKPVTTMGIVQAQLRQKFSLADGGKATLLEIIVKKGITEIAKGQPKQWPQTSEFLAQFDPKQKYVPGPNDEERLAALIAEMAEEDPQHEEE